jgi:hypothetical protein
MQFTEEQIIAIRQMAEIQMPLNDIAKAIQVDALEFRAEYEKETELYKTIESAAMEMEKKIWDNVFHLASAGDPEMMKLAVNQIAKRKINDGRP